ncbi:hypothetical protein CBOM_00925 [Ceraceosorus bombacis]|uniref:AB hydrolase-1 domain-containing protein n=1 Tax=Ceraceosorus bombacis TaxID=401625 RepID=A0A0P1BAC3_9BASI|nr:hypothetical protein CBOM_00925 [Ceraceosorus bombacis]
MMVHPARTPSDVGVSGSSPVASSSRTGGSASPAGAARRSYFDLYPERRGQGPYVPPTALTPKLSRKDKSSPRTDVQREREREGERRKALQAAASKVSAWTLEQQKAKIVDTPSCPEVLKRSTGAARVPTHQPREWDVASQQALPGQPGGVDARAFLLNAGPNHRERNKLRSGNISSSSSSHLLRSSRSEMSLRSVATNTITPSSTSSSMLGTFVDPPLPPDRHSNGQPVERKDSGMSPSASVDHWRSLSSSRMAARATSEKRRSPRTQDQSAIPMPSVESQEAARVSQESQDGKIGRSAEDVAAYTAAAAAAAQRSPGGFPVMMSSVTRRRSAQNLAALSSSSSVEQIAILNSPATAPDPPREQQMRASRGSAVSKQHALPERTHGAPTDCRKVMQESRRLSRVPLAAIPDSPAPSIISIPDEASTVSTTSEGNGSLSTDANPRLPGSSAMPEGVATADPEDTTPKLRQSAWGPKDQENGQSRPQVGANVNLTGRASSLNPTARLDRRPAPPIKEQPLSIEEIIRRGTSQTPTRPITTRSISARATSQAPTVPDLAAEPLPPLPPVRATYAASSAAVGKALPPSSATAARLAPKLVPSIDDIIRGHAAQAWPTHGKTSLASSLSIPSAPPGQARSLPPPSPSNVRVYQSESESRSSSESEEDDGASAASHDSVLREVRESLRAERRKARMEKAAAKAAARKAAEEEAMQPVGAPMPRSARRKLHHATSFPTRPVGEFGEIGTVDPMPSSSRLSRRASRRSTASYAADDSVAQRADRTASKAPGKPPSFVSEPVPPMPGRKGSAEDKLNTDVTQYLRSSRLTRLIKLEQAPYAGLTVSLADVGAPNGHPVVIFLGLGVVRYIIALYDDMAAVLGLRLICIDRWGMGKSDDLSAERRGVVEWSNVVAEVTGRLGVSKYSVLGHSAGGPYAMATCLRFPEKVAGPAHLLAPWVGTSVESGYKWLKYVPDSVIKTAQAAEWKVQGWKLGKLPSLTYESIGYDARTSGNRSPSYNGAISPRIDGSTSGWPAMHGEEMLPPVSPTGTTASSGDKSSDLSMRDSSIHTASRVASPSLQVPSTPILSTPTRGTSKALRSKPGRFNAFLGGSGSKTSSSQSDADVLKSTPDSVRSAQAREADRRSQVSSQAGDRSPIPRWGSSSSLASAKEGMVRSPRVQDLSDAIRSTHNGSPKLVYPDEAPVVPCKDRSARSSIFHMRRSESALSVQEGDIAWASAPNGDVSLDVSTTSSSRNSGSWGRKRNHAMPSSISTSSIRDSPSLRERLEVYSPDSTSPAAPTSAQKGLIDLPTAILRASHAESLKGGAADLLTILGRASQRPWGFTYADVQHPTIVWHGDKDERISLSGVLWMEREMRECKVNIVKGGTHSLMTDVTTFVEALESISAHRND